MIVSDVDYNPNLTHTPNPNLSIQAFLSVAPTATPTYRTTPKDERFWVSSKCAFSAG